MNSWVSPLSGKKTLSVFAVPDWWHSGVAVGTRVGEDIIPGLLHPTRSNAAIVIMITGDCFTFLSMRCKKRMVWIVGPNDFALE